LSLHVFAHVGEGHLSGSDVECGYSVKAQYRSY